MAIEGRQTITKRIEDNRYKLHMASVDLESKGRGPEIEALATWLDEVAGDLEEINEAIIEALTSSPADLKLIGKIFGAEEAKQEPHYNGYHPEGQTIQVPHLVAVVR